METHENTIETRKSTDIQVIENGLDVLTDLDYGEEGNTETQKGEYKCRKWHIVIFNYTEKLIEILKNWLKSYYIIGREICPDTGRPHIHLYFEKLNAVKRTTIENIVKKAGNFEGWYCKAKGTREQNIKYCSKDNNYEMGFEENIQEIAKEIVKNNLDNKMEHAYPWQKDVMEIINENANDRTIHWFWETNGNTGKTTLANYLILNYNTIICDGKEQDVFNQVNYMLTKEKKMPYIIIVDIPRHKKEFTNYGMIEKLKNGILYSGKYEGGKCIFPSPHVLVFSNNPPDVNKFSKDRWDIRNITNEFKFKKNNIEDFNIGNYIKTCKCKNPLNCICEN